MAATACGRWDIDCGWYLGRGPWMDLKSFWDNNPGFLAIGDGRGYPTGPVVFRRITAIEIRQRLEKLGIVNEPWLIIDLWNIVCAYTCAPSVSDFDKYHLEAIAPPLDVPEDASDKTILRFDGDFTERNTLPFHGMAMQWRVTRCLEFDPGFSFPGHVPDLISLNEYKRLIELGADYLNQALAPEAFSSSSPANSDT
jgi:hypothetical protein